MEIPVDVNSQVCQYDDSSPGFKVKCLKKEDNWIVQLIVNSSFVQCDEMYVRCFDTLDPVRGSKYRMLSYEGTVSNWSFKHYLTRKK